MIFFRNHNLIVFFLIAIFGFASVNTCDHGHFGDEIALTTFQETIKTAETVVTEPCGDCDDSHDSHSDSHSCACSCHTPTSVGSLLTAFFASHTENIHGNHLNIFAKGFLNRIDRPPKLS